MAEAKLRLQWKGTDICGDFHCECGAHFHIDDDFVYNLKCAACGAFWELDPNIKLTRLDAEPECCHDTATDMSISHEH